MDPFAAAVDALFSAPGSTPATYTPSVGGAVAAIRVIRSQPDRTVGFGGSQIIEGTNTFEIRKSDVARPMSGDIVTIGSENFRLLGEPMIDVEGLTWTIGATEAA